MTCCHCQSADRLFGSKVAFRQLKQYRKKGPTKPTRLVLEALANEGVGGASLLDIGGGVGAIQHALIQAGASRVVSADASQGYLAAAREEAERAGYADRADYRHGDFVELAPELEDADVVTLDRVVCCYPDMPRLVSLSAGKARRLYALVHPRGKWFIRAALAVGNAFLWLVRSAFRTYAHPPDAIDATVRDAGFERVFLGETFIWRAVVYRRSTPLRG